VLLVSTRALKTVSFTDTKTTTEGAFLTAVSGMEVQTLKACGFGFVVDKGLELAKTPPMESRSQPFTRFDPPTDIRQILQDNRPCFLSYGLFYDLFTDGMVNMPHAAAFSARDFLQQLFCRRRTVGLKGSPLCKKSIPLMANLASAKEFSTAQRCGIVLSQIDSQKGGMVYRFGIGKVQDEVEIPLPFPTDQLPFFGKAFGEVTLLKRSHLHGHFDTSFQGIKRKGFSSNGIGSFVEVNASIFAKANHRDFLFGKKAFGFVSFTDGENGTDDHLRSEQRSRSYLRVDEVVKTDAIPTPMLYGIGNNLIARIKIGLLQLMQLKTLFFGNLKPYTDGAFHWIKILCKCYLTFNLKRERCFLPALKSWVSALSIG
jgi:hypothetical protein